VINDWTVAPTTTTQGPTRVSFSQVVPPSDTSQVVNVQEKLKITIPAYVLSKEANLIVNAVNQNTWRSLEAPYQALGTYMISLGDVYQFPFDPLIIEIKYDQKSLKGISPPEYALTAMYYDEEQRSLITLPTMVDPVNQTLRVLTWHLSEYSTANG
jgi:hypothetical protein